MAIADFVAVTKTVNQDELITRLHRATCRKIPAGKVETLEELLSWGVTRQARTAVPASCCKPKAAMVYVQDVLAAEKTETPVTPDDGAELISEVFDVPVEVVRAETPATQEDWDRFAEPDAVVAARETFDGDAVYLGPAYLWPAARRGAVLFLGDRDHKVVAAQRLILVDGSIAEELQKRLDNGIIALREAREAGRFEGMPRVKEWTKSARYALEQEIVRDAVSGVSS